MNVLIKFFVCPMVYLTWGCVLIECKKWLMGQIAVLISFEDDMDIGGYFAKFISVNCRFIVKMGVNWCPITTLR
jgi:hypothetical protein